MWILLFVSMIVILVGLMTIWTPSSYSSTTPVVVVGVVMIFVGIVGCIVSGVILNNAANDRESRTTTVTEVVAESYQTWTKENGCVQSFALNNVPYALEKGCASFTEHSYLPPKAGDVMRVKFVRPKNPEGKPEVLEVYNLTQEMERARSAPSPTPEALPTN